MKTLAFFGAQRQLVADCARSELGARWLAYRTGVCIGGPLGAPRGTCLGAAAAAGAAAVAAAARTKNARTHTHTHARGCLSCEAAVGGGAAVLHASQLIFTSSTYSGAYPGQCYERRDLWRGWSAQVASPWQPMT